MSPVSRDIFVKFVHCAMPFLDVMRHCLRYFIVCNGTGVGSPSAILTFSDFPAQRLLWFGRMIYKTSFVFLVATAAAWRPRDFSNETNINFWRFVREQSSNVSRSNWCNAAWIARIQVHNGIVEPVLRWLQPAPNYCDASTHKWMQNAVTQWARVSNMEENSFGEA